MPDNDLERRLAVIESEFGLARPQQTDVRASHTDNINWKALYKSLSGILISAELRPELCRYLMSRLAEHLPRR